MKAPRKKGRPKKLPPIALERRPPEIGFAWCPRTHGWPTDGLGIVMRQQLDDDSWTEIFKFLDAGEVEVLLRRLGDQAPWRASRGVPT